MKSIPFDKKFTENQKLLRLSIRKTEEKECEYTRFQLYRFHFLIDEILVEYQKIFFFDW